MAANPVGTSGHTAEGIGETRGRATSDLPGRIWLYLSGGGLRSALGSVGVIWFLNQGVPSRWDRVTRVAAVSGGALVNAALLRHGLTEDFHRNTFDRLTRHGPLLAYWKPIVTTLVATLVGWWIFSRPLLLTSRWTVLLLILYVVGVVQVVASLYTRRRITWIVNGGTTVTSHRPSPPPANAPPTVETEGAGSGPLLLFGATDLPSGLPTYLMTRRSRPEDRSTRLVVAAHDRRSMIDQVEFFDHCSSHPDHELSPAELAYISASWPFLVLPRTITLTGTARAAAEDETRPFRLAWKGRKTADRVTAESEAAARRTFVLVDGGFTGTLGGRLDGSLQGSDRADVMDLVSLDGDSGADSSNNPVHRIVVDGGRYNEASSSRAFGLPGFGALWSVARALKIALDHQITVDRYLVPTTNTWHVAVTGRDRQFRRPSRIVRSIRTRFRRRRARMMATAARGTDCSDATTQLVERLRGEADHVGLLRGYRRRGLACAASGVAGAWVESKEAGATNHAELVDLLHQFEEALVAKGGLEEIISGAARRTGYRWPQLNDLHTTRPTDHRLMPVAVSHRGDISAGAPDNSAEAFRMAYDQGFRVLECDVQLTRDNELVALHGTFGLVRGRGWRRFRPRRVHSLDLTDLVGHLGYRPTAISELIAHLPGDVTWNFEAKRRLPMHALLDEIESRDMTNVIVSSGYRHDLIRYARRRRPSLLTAASLPEQLRFAFGGRPPLHCAVIQLPIRLRVLFASAAGRAARAGVQVYWFGVNRSGTIDDLIADPDVGIVTDNHQLVATTLGLVGAR